MIQIATHHRCGTVLMRNTFRKYCDLTSQTFYKGDAANLPEKIDIFQNAHSRTIDIVPNDASLGVHLYRDPIKLLLSHIKYHEKSESEYEASNKLMIDGVLYRDYLKSIKGINAKAKFEIENIYGRTLKLMLDWDYSDKRFLNLDLDRFRDNEIEETVKVISSHFQLRDEELLLKSFRLANGNAEVKKKHGTSHSSNNEELSDELFSYLDVKFPKLKKFMGDFGYSF